MKLRRVGEETRGLSEMERVVDVFVAPAATFRDILRSTSWWLPFLLIVVFSTAATFAIDRHVGLSRVAENQVHASPAAEQQLAQLSADERASQMEKRAIGTRYFTYGLPVFLLLVFAVYAGIMFGDVQVRPGSEDDVRAGFRSERCIASLPYLLTSLLTFVTVWFGNNAESFNLQNPVGTNLAYYLSDPAPWLRVLLAQFDLVKLWTLVLTVLGIKIVAKSRWAQCSGGGGGLVAADCAGECGGHGGVQLGELFRQRMKRRADLPPMQTD